MRFKIIFLVFFLSCNCAFGQTDLPVDSAFEHFHNGNYSKAIKLYKQLIATDHRPYRNYYHYEMLAMCYTKMDSLQEAIDILKQVIYPDKPTNMRYDQSIQLNCSQQLADIYFKQKEYRKALILYNMHDIKWMHAHFSDINGLAYNYRQAGAVSKCYEELKQIDSATLVLTPYIFCDYRSLTADIFFPGPKNIRDSLKHDSVCMRYLSLLKKQYSIKNIKAELKKAESEFTYTKTIEHKRNDTTFLWMKVVCDFHFYGVKVPYMEYEAGITNKEMMVFSKRPVFTRQYQLDYFNKLPLCSMIHAM